MQTVTSKEVAEMLGKRHDNLMREVRKYISSLGETEAPKYFLDGAYKDGLGKERSCYLVTLAGCDLMAGRLLGEKHTEFKEKYLPLFNPTEPNIEAVKPVQAYTVQEAIELLGISERSIYRNIENGKLKAVKCTVMVPTEKLMIPVEELEAYKAERSGK